MAPGQRPQLADAAAATACSEGWVRRLCERYNAEEPEALDDRRRDDGAAPSILTPEVLDRLRQHLAEPPADTGGWTSDTGVVRSHTNLHWIPKTAKPMLKANSSTGDRVIPWP
ncbi:helix-turn-helix domain-containing protein [Methylobacterium aquaticum]|uniref:helix-turn-helix domain-containing protein n=1 Tax=Methylobacterium aquaticum TaxID=270351 RepID=UPI001AF2CF3E|nr:helix-turn-helix domain-containing protein [Methylobacterium aquaticum]